MTALDELKRVDHLVFVTLKYSRTIEVMRTILLKLTQVIDSAILEFYEAALENKIIKETPSIPLIRLKNLEKMYPKENMLKEIVDFYVYLKKLYNSPFKGKEEYRKNITLIVANNEITVETLKQYILRVGNYISYIKELSTNL